MKKLKKKYKRNRILVYFIMIIIFINIIKLICSINSFYGSSDYKVIKQDFNKNYSGIGQESVEKRDGYFTTFTTVDDYKKIYKEYKQNGNSSWSDNEYWDGIMSDEGCGITAMAIILSGYGKEYTPEDLREKYFPVLNYNKMSKELCSQFNIENSDFYYDSIHLSKDSLIEHLSTNRPIIVCVWDNPKENRWTKLSHYMVLLATDGENMVYVSNPNGGKNDCKSSGWYKFEEVVPYIAKAMYIESYE